MKNIPFDFPFLGFVVRTMRMLHHLAKAVNPQEVVCVQTELRVPTVERGALHTMRIATEPNQRVT